MKTCRPLLLAEYLLRLPLAAGAALALLLIAVEQLVWNAVTPVMPGNERDFSVMTENARFETIFTAFCVAAMALLAFCVLSCFAGTKPVYSLTMLPVGRGWIVLVWCAGGAAMLLLLVSAQLVSVKIAGARLTGQLLALSSYNPDLLVYIEPGAEWLSYFRSEFLGRLLPRDIAGWLRLLVSVLGTPAVVVRMVVGLKARRYLSSITAALFYALLTALLASANVFLLLILAYLTAGCCFYSAWKIMREGDAV